MRTMVCVILLIAVSVVQGSGQEVRVKTRTGSFLNDVDIPPAGLRRNPDAVAVVIGNFQYDNKDVPLVDFAIRDSRAVKDYLVKGLGFQPANIIYEENASKAAFERIFGTPADFKGQLYNYTLQKKPDVFVYYSGHGAPDLESKQTFFVPSDCDPNYVRINGYSLKTFYDNLAKLKVKGVTVVLEACFSGGSHAGGLIKSASPSLTLSIEKPVPTVQNINVFSSSASEEISSWFVEKRHGLFTYYFLEALKGGADVNKDGKITMREVKQHILENVSFVARRYNRSQNPDITLQDPDKIVLEYKR